MLVRSQPSWWARMLVNQTSFIQRFFSILRAGGRLLQQVTHQNRSCAKDAQFCHSHLIRAVRLLPLSFHQCFRNPANFRTVGPYFAGSHLLQVRAQFSQLKLR